MAFAPLSGFFPTRDGWVRTHGNYPHHASALRMALGRPQDAGPGDAARALAARTTEGAVAAVIAAGGICAAVQEKQPDLAGPIATRTLALLGADVLRIDPPGLPEIVAQLSAWVTPHLRGFDSIVQAESGIA